MTDIDVKITGLKEHMANTYTEERFGTTLGDWLKRQINAGRTDSDIARELAPLCGGVMTRQTIYNWLKKRHIETVRRARTIPGSM